MTEPSQPSAANTPREAERSLSKQLLHAVNLASFIAAIGVLLFLLVSEFVTYRQVILNDLRVQSRMIASNSAVAIEFEDQRAAQGVLSAWRESPDVRLVALYDAHNNVFATYRSAPDQRVQPPSRPPQAAQQIRLDRLELSEPIYFAERRTGTLYLRGSWDRLYWRLASYAIVIAAIFALSLLLAHLLLTRALRRLIKPLSDLTQVTKRVSAQHDYAARAPIEGPSEIGTLAQSFNAMLDQIQQRDAQLQLELDERERAEQRLDYLAYHDTVTGLPNRRFFNEQLPAALDRARKLQRKVALLFLDLDNFKLVNDTLGHDVGDQLLEQLGQRLRQTLRANDTICRIGGDEFVVLAENLVEHQQISPLIDKLRTIKTAPFVLNERELYITCSVGISVFPDDGEDTQTLLGHADAAMYDAKGSGKDDFRFFTSEMSARAAHRLNLETRLRQALERNELILHYQPQIDTRSGRVLSMEALLRWPSNEAQPSEFISVAEQTGLIGTIGSWVLRTACEQAVRWRQAGYLGFSIAVNLSARQLRERDLTQRLAATIQETGLPAHCLELELTESSLVDDAQATLARLGQIEALGVALTVDDFGVGYSSMGYLKRFPIKKIKIDRSFISGIPDDADDVAITAAIIAMAQQLHINVVAEGVETPAQAAHLTQSGCDGLQGYLLCKPASAEDITRWLASHHAGASLTAAAAI